MRYILLFIFICSALLPLKAQQPEKLTSNQIYERIQKLNFLGSVLYVAAHPDDENTKLISYLSNKVKARTTYLSLTRGDGGQNLIGSEIREALGVIRTQELLAARSVDGGEQLFSRANDFGYSKNPKETLQIWDEEQVLSDVVWAIRNVQPDVIINRFDHRTPGTTHGHHTASAMLSFQAFDLAGDKKQFPEQLDYVDVWKTKRLFFNTHWWFYKSEEAFAKEDKSDFVSVDVGVYYPLKGLSNNEVAAVASSQHLCQGFGRLSIRGSEIEYLEPLRGRKPKKGAGVFSGINTSWTRVKGGKQIATILETVEKQFNFRKPSEHLPELMEAYALIQQLENTHWRTIKEKEIVEIIEACAGLYLEASTKNSSTNPYGKVVLAIETLNRSEAPIELEAIVLKPENKTIHTNLLLTPNKKEIFKETSSLNGVSYTNPYWLNKQGTIGMYTVNEEWNLGNPETTRVVKVAFELLIEGKPITIEKEVVYRFAKRDKGELYQPFEIVPVVTSKIEEKVLVFETEKAQQVKVKIVAGADAIKGNMQLEAPEGWSVLPENKAFSIAEKGDEVTETFKITPPNIQAEGLLKSLVTVDGKIHTKELIEINYDHIPKQTLLQPAVSKIVRLDIQKKGTNIGYIQGAGDKVPESLREIGYTVTQLDVATINTETLKKFDAVILGIRAYNTLEKLKFKQSYLLEYVKKGGNMIVQYNTSGWGGVVDVQAPYPLNVSTDRVTDENSAITFLTPEHPLLNTPNKIEQTDFEGWVQERGLYFPDNWSKEYTPILEMKDAGETPKKGALLVARYGKGYYVYTGLSFFRELPAGVPGAYKLFANMLSVGK